jgi:cell division protease FtsH
MNQRWRNFAIWIVVVLLLLALFTLFQNPGTRTRTNEIPYSQFVTSVDEGRVREVVLRGPDISGTFTDGRAFQSYGPANPDLIPQLQSKGVAVTIRPQQDEEKSRIISLIVSWLPFVALIGVWIFMSQRIKRAEPVTTSAGRPGEIAELRRRLEELERRVARLDEDKF